MLNNQKRKFQSRVNFTLNHWKYVFDIVLFPMVFKSSGNYFSGILEFNKFVKMVGPSVIVFKSSENYFSGILEHNKFVNHNQAIYYSI